MKLMIKFILIVISARRFTKDHEWIELGEGNIGTVGITQYAQVSFCCPQSINSLYHDLQAYQSDSCCSTVLSEEQCERSFIKFHPVTEGELLEIIKETKMKSCSLDPPLPACIRQS